MPHMGVEGVLGEKKLRRAQDMVGFPLFRAWAWGPSKWEACTPDDRHLHLNPRTGEWEWFTPTAHFMSCPDPEGNPAKTPWLRGG